MSLPAGLLADLETALDDGIYARFVLRADPEDIPDVLAVIDRHVAGWRPRPSRIPGGPP